MDSSPEEVFYDVNNEALPKSKSEMDKKSVYFVLEKSDLCSDGEGDDSNDLSREDKYKTASSDLMSQFKGGTIEKSKVNVANRLKMFEQQGAIPKDKVTSTPSPSSGHHNSQNSNPELTINPNARSTADNYYDKLWENQTGAHDQIYEEYTMAEPISPPADGDEQIKSTPPFSPTSKPNPKSIDNLQNSDTDDDNIYSVASSIPFSPSPVSSPKTKSKTGSKSLFYMSSPVPMGNPMSSTECLKPSVNKGIQQGSGAAVPVDFMHPVKDSSENSDSEYNKLYFKSTAPGSGERAVTPSMKLRLKERGYGSLASVKSSDTSNRKSSKSGLGMYDSDVSDDEDDVSLDWGSEFDDMSYQESIDDLFLEEQGAVKDDSLPDKPLPPKPVKGKFAYQDLIPKQLRLTSQSDQQPNNLDLSSSAVCLPVKINPTKHPPPCLPTEPDGLTDVQKKRRCVIDLIISSEKSYLESLERILKQYEKQILEAIPNPKARVRVVFAATREIISHHRMFQIELSEAVTSWDMEEKIGDIFTASFSKTMVVNAYSIYVNNFSAAMEEIRTAQRNKQSFDDFLRDREKINSDRLSVFGLMVKPVQRFPQFIMCLQDLIKYMPSDHHDRQALQLALTELENVTHMLNERKRCSEQRFQALQTIHQLIRQKAKHMLTGWNLDMNTSRRLIRYDAMEQVFGEFESMKCKDRRLILMNDLVICVKVIEKEQSGFRVERLGLRWMAKLKDLELKDTAITPDMQSIVKRQPGKIHIISSQMAGDKSEEDPFHLYADLSEMLHDYTVLGQMSALVSTLKRSYTGHGLSEELVHEISRDLQRMIQIKDEQLRLVNSCSLVLVDHSRSDKPQYVLQTQTAAIKQDWSVDFLMAKLAQDRSNSPAWDRTHSSDDLEHDAMPAIFMKTVPVDVPRNYTKTKCAVSVFLNPEKSSGLGIQHLWVCSSNRSRGQVSILSIHNSKPALTESFKACDCDIMSAELVPGCGEVTSPDKYLFVEDTVWMATCNKDILVFPISNSSGVRRDPLVSVKTLSTVISIRFVDERVFCGLDNGTMCIYSREFDGAWNMNNPSVINFGSSFVRIHFVWEENLWLSCRNTLFVVETDSLETKAEQLLHADHETLIDHVTRAGMGIWVSFTNSAFIKLFHVETLENLQEMSIGHFLQRIAAEKIWTLNPITEDIQVTSLASSRGLLWIGTNLGVVLTLTLPRLSDGVPLYRGRPSVSLHAHRGPVKFLIPLVCASNTMELKRSSTLRSTLSSRPSRRNIERERLELEESERKGGGDNNNNNEKDLKSTFVDKQKETSEDESSPIYDDGISITHNPNVDSNNVRVGDNGRDENVGDEVYENMDELTSSSQNENNVKTGNEDKLWTSFDDDPVVFRKRGSREFSSLKVGKGRNLSFRSELAQRIIVQSRRMSGSCGDLLSMQPLEVEVLYENLLEDDNGSMDRVGGDDTKGKRHTLSNFRSSNLRKLSSASQMQQTKDSQQQQQKDKSVTDSSSKKDKKSLKSSRKSSSKISSSVSTPALLSDAAGNGKTPEAPPRKSRQTSNADAMAQSRLSRATTMRGTMRKSGGNNAVIVLSGGDGYRDLNSSRNQSRSDDACIMLWIYKF